MQRTDPAAKRHCPYCGCDRIAHSRFRRVIEGQLLRTFHMDAYRCCDCGTRFYGRSGSSRSSSSRAA